MRLYVAWNYPFCHRVLVALALIGLHDRESSSWMHNIKGAVGWEILPGDDPLFEETTVHGVYDGLTSEFAHTLSVPMLVDWSSRNVRSTSPTPMMHFLSNIMKGIFSMELNPIFNDLERRIDQSNRWLHENVSRAVYRVGFATSQAHCKIEVAQLFHSLASVKIRLASKRYLLGDTVRESDFHLHATPVRFDRAGYQSEKIVGPAPKHYQTPFTIH